MVDEEEHAAIGFGADDPAGGLQHAVDAGVDVGVFEALFQALGKIIADQLAFETDGGELWTMGPCCGSETGPTVSQFPFVVSWTANGPRVLTMPVYTP